MKLRRIFSCIIAFAIAITLLPKVNVQAEESIPVAPTDFGLPISVTTYEDEEGCVVTERIYFYSDTSSKLRGKSGEGWYRNEKTHEWKAGAVTTYYAQGYFTWGDGEVSVSNVTGGANNVNGITLSNKLTTSGTGRYGFVFNKYAYVTFSCTATNLVGLTQDLSVTIRVSESGNTI